MKSTAKKRKTSSATKRMQARWLSYAAAGAASVAAGSQADAAVIVNSGDLPAGSLPVQILDPAGSNGATAVPTTLELDLNNDGFVDVTIQHFHSQSFYSNGSSATYAAGRAGASGSILGDFTTYGGYDCSPGSTACFHYAVRFTNLSSIGPAHPDIANASNYYMRDGYGFPNSGWAADPSAGFLGVRFDIHGGGLDLIFPQCTYHSQLRIRDQRGRGGGDTGAHVAGTDGSGGRWRDGAAPPRSGARRRLVSREEG